jgi:hypothetical protein
VRGCIRHRREAAQYIGQTALFRVDDSLVQQLKLCVRPEVLKC